jgi:hypothetical protein
MSKSPRRRSGRRSRSRKSSRSTRRVSNTETVGHLYIAKNESMPGLLKIGCTVDPDRRMAELQGTGVPTPFVLEWASVRLYDMYAAEQKLHRALKRERVADNREFFSLPYSRAVSRAIEVEAAFEDAAYRARIESEEVAHRARIERERRIRAETEELLQGFDEWLKGPEVKGALVDLSKGRRAKFVNVREECVVLLIFIVPFVTLTFGIPPLALISLLSGVSLAALESRLDSSASNRYVALVRSCTDALSRSAPPSYAPVIEEYREAQAALVDSKSSPSVSAIRADDAAELRRRYTLYLSRRPQTVVTWLDGTLDDT